MNYEIREDAYECINSVIKTSLDIMRENRLKINPDYLDIVSRLLLQAEVVFDQQEQLLAQLGNVSDNHEGFTLKADK